jgi:biotin carboxyl carrier protein
MKTRKQCLVSGVIAALSIPFSVHAADPPRCNELFDDAQRLGCYDAVFGKPLRSGAQATAPVAPAVPVASAAPAAPVAAASATAAATTAAVMAPQPAPKADAAAAKPEKFNSSVTALGSSADGRFIATLENGQQWLQTERDSRIEVKVGDAVSLQPMMFGAYTMVTRTGYSIRVKRLK